MKQRIGVYICHCGGNISDYVDVEQLGKLMAKENGVLISKNVMFACSDSTQKEIEQDIEENKLDSIVVASCSPKLHTHTFRNVAIRAGLNPYNYTQVNIREQCSWAHSDKPMDATIKAYGLIRAGINRVSYSEVLESLEISAQKVVAIIGAGVAGMRAAVDLARMDNQVYLIEKGNTVGGHVAQAGRLFPTNENGKEVVDRLYQRIRQQSNITLFTNATLEKVSGSIGNFWIEVKLGSEELKLNVGSVLVTTGFDFYDPKEGEFGYRLSDRVITLPDFNKMVENSKGKLIHNGKSVKSVAYIYCVGNRQSKGENRYCSRQCCTAAIHSSLHVHEKFEDMTAYHLFRDIRTYGKQELLYQQSSKNGDIYIRFEEKEPPVVELKNGNPTIKVKDYLTTKRELTLDTDLVVLVTGMVPRTDSNSVSSKLKIPIGIDRFFNEIHPKLKPVETVIKGVYIGGACQGPKNINESVQSALSGAAKINATLKSGNINLEPIIARVNADSCLWCGKCAEVCEYDAISSIANGGKLIAEVNKATCKGCGICAPTCPSNAIELAQFTDNEIESMIDGLMSKAEISPRVESQQNNQKAGVQSLAGYPKIWRTIANALEGNTLTIPQIAEKIDQEASLVTWHLMTMNRYGFVESAGLNDNEDYFMYKLKK
ncbi:MAG: CoB--CoM heterodisulfide reductase iron-sulfur subunit A family protein [Bacteroidales bacterium]|nr:MAG: CoB--CoM heterodisulfide reductase iron-sulfur subunit A family protein [Bacteroidales bacterium]